MAFQQHLHTACLTLLCEIEQPALAYDFGSSAVGDHSPRGADGTCTAMHGVSEGQQLLLCFCNRWVAATARTIRSHRGQAVVWGVAVPQIHFTTMVGEGRC